MAQNEVVAYIQDGRRAGVSYDEIDEALCQKSVLLAAVARRVSGGGTPRPRRGGGAQAVRPQSISRTTKPAARGWPRICALVDFHPRGGGGICA